MAAPAGAYSNKNLNTYKDGVVYNNIALSNDAEQIIKNRFFLDHLLNTNEGFIGMCYINSYNYNHHNPNRIGSINGYKDGVMKNYLDAGLNTKGHASIGNILTTHVNRIKTNTTWTSSYYAPSSLRGFSVAGQNGQWFDYYNTDEIIPANTSINTDEYAYTNLSFAQTVYIRPIIQNEEGTYYGDTVSFFGTDPVLGYMCQYRSSPCVSTTDNILVWMSELDYSRLDIVTENQSSTGIKVYYDDNFSEPVSGYLAELKDGKVYFVNNGEVLSWVYCAPPVQQKDLTIYVNLEDDGFGGTYYSVFLTLNTGVKPFDISVSGAVGYFNSQDNQIFGGTGGNGNFNLYIPAGQSSANYATTLPYYEVAAYAKAVQINVSPTSLTFEAIRG